MKLYPLLTTLMLIFVPLGPALANAPLCADLASTAGAQAGLPQGLLPAISLVETGTGGAPWPWTLNEGGKGMYFKTRAEALAYLKAAVDRGVTNIDVGCMQLNYRWHSAGFSSLEEMIDPHRNTTYAALFMLELKKRLGTWKAATAHYHSTDPDRGARYVQKVAAALGQAPEPGETAPQMAEAEATPSPADAGSRGSLLLASGRALIVVDQGGSSDYAALLEGAAQDAAVAMTKAPNPELLARDDASPRLRHRWDAILAARAQLFASQ